jgi:hypothetical protein
MSDKRFRAVFLLVILILLVVSALTGLLSWWLSPHGSGPPDQGSGTGGGSRFLNHVEVDLAFSEAGREDGKDSYCHRFKCQPA